MKTTGISILITAIIIFGFTLKVSAECQDDKKQENKSVPPEKTTVTVGNDLLSVEHRDSSVNIRIGNRGMNILESLEGNKIHFENYNRNKDWNQEDREEEHARRRNRFKGHWAGVELGFNNYVTAENSLSLPDDIDYMTLHSGKSTNFNINFAQLSLGLMRHFGVVTGLGLTWNNYRFDGNNNIQKGDNGIIERLDPGDQLEKSKLATIYLDLPVMLEFQIPADNHHLNFAAGPVGAIKLGSHSKMVYKNGEKVKSNEDFSLNMMRVGATARVGYQNFQLYGTYYWTPLFQSAKSPGGHDLYPCEIGIAFTFND
jgi:hypothetical protein